MVEKLQYYQNHLNLVQNDHMSLVHIVMLLILHDIHSIEKHQI